ncbi:MurR/RpiR family transcriptional regulator [Streptomyces sp. MZ04]|uniref:MurR/RpiR family transcriptional regulator n=1 Tax=Streptomyces sp. MZ04 TaxID=2559236 RepID=UPI00107EBDDE|nr:MurR/RpiR family transcriptional regulator [Streptomyces sp. MZ04]TGA90907.1 MurR/RpiR family transcriptional regulator [Streptomyces sp. MZ04]
MSIEDWLKKRVGAGTLGRQTENVVRVLAREPQFASYASAREVAERAAVNVSTVVRTAQHLGFDGWPGLRAELRAHYLDALAAEEFPPFEGAAEDSVGRTLRLDAINLAALASADSQRVIKAVAAEIRKAEPTLVVGSGAAAGPAHVLGHIGVIFGYDIQLAVGAATAQAAQVMRLREGSCLLAISIWRVTRALRELVRLAHERGVTVCLITDLRSSPLAEDADHVIVVPTEGVRSLPSFTAAVSVVQAILAELSGTQTTVAYGQVEQAWQRMDLMDDTA